MSNGVDRKMSDALSEGVPRRKRKRLYRALGNVLMGVAVGLLAYYLVTDVVAGAEQSSLKTSLEELGPVGTSDSGSDIPVEDEGPVMDFSGWESEDKEYWDSLPMGGVFGRLVIEGMKLDVAVVKGATPRTLKKGPGWITTTSLPGPTGNCGVSGHRTTYRAPFRRLDRLEPGDIIDLYSPYRRYRYEVEKTFAVRPWQVEVLRATVDPTLTLTACHPPYSAAYRLIVRSKLIAVTRIAETAPDALD